MKTHTFTRVDGKRIRYRIVLDEVCHEWAEIPETDRKRRPKYELYVNAELPPRLRLDRLIHAAIHALDPKMPERRVELFGRQLARLLSRAGFTPHH